MNYKTRYGQRKKRRINRLLNIAIGIVAILIIYFAVQLFFNFGSTEEAVADTEQQEQEQEENQAEEILDQTIEENRENNTVEDEANRDDAESEELRKDENEEEESGANEEFSQGPWQPIGTVQSEPFEINFSKDHVNWKEMTHALQYATGLGDDIILWRIENGGDSMSAVGTVSDKDNKDTPYQVRIEWVPERGWKPVEVIQLSENPYLR